jgi:hypothetical protein
VSAPFAPSRGSAGRARHGGVTAAVGTISGQLYTPAPQLRRKYSDFGTEQIPNPAAYASRPSGTETFMELIDTNSYTCSSALPQPHPCSEGANVEYLPGIHGQTGGWCKAVSYTNAHRELRAPLIEVSQ